MTNPPIDRKVFQRVKTETEQNERFLGRTIITTLATCATVVGWMMFANTTPASAVTKTPVVASANSAPVEVRLDYAPIPTVYALPNLAPLSPLAQQRQSVVASMAVSNNGSVASRDVVTVAPTPIAQPVVRVVARPAAPIIPVAKTGGSK